MSGGTFTITSNITLTGIQGSFDIYAYLNGTTVTLYKDAGGTQAYASDPDFLVPALQKYALYFRFTNNSPSNAVFPVDPFSWLDASKKRPSTVSYEKMTQDHRSFSIEVDNSVQHTRTNRYPFDLLVTTGQGQIFRLDRGYFKVDPTIVEKGEAGPDGGIDPKVKDS